MLAKTKPYRSKKLLAASAGRSCVRCGRDDGTVVRAHYTGPRQHAYGKGKGQKGSDHVAADLCLPCHEMFDRYSGDWESKTEASEEFLHLCMLTLWLDLEAGVLR